MRAELNARCSTSAGTYNSLGTRLSGSPFTTDGNTIIAAYIVYRDNRRTMPVEVAYHQIGLHYGDDGISYPSYTLVDTAAQHGFTLKLDHYYERIPFLGRYYVAPRSGSLSSFQDPVRTLTKFHVIVGDRTDEQAHAIYRAKAGAYLLQDHDTPIIGDFMRAVLRVVPEAAHVRLTRNDLSWGVCDAMEHEAHPSQVFVSEPKPDTADRQVRALLAEQGFDAASIASALHNVALAGHSGLDTDPAECTRLDNITIDGAHVFVRHTEPPRPKPIKVPRTQIPFYPFVPQPVRMIRFEAPRRAHIQPITADELVQLCNLPAATVEDDCPDS